MPAPTTYSESTLKQFMVDELGATGVALSLTTSANAITNAVYACERLLGDAIVDLTDMALLEAAARWQAWLAAKKAAANQFNVKLSGGKAFDRSQWFEQIGTNLSDAEAAYYTALAASEATSGTGSSFFAFATVRGCRGR